MGLKFSVVIPAHNAERTLTQVLSAVRAEASAVPLEEVIVVNDGSADATAELARAGGAKVVSQARLGPAAARNLGARYARGEVIVFLDADCVPEQGALSALLEPFSEADVAGVRGGYTTHQRSPVARFAQLELDEKQERLGRNGHVVFVDTACAAYRREDFLCMGGFDESFRAPSVEDVDLSFRMAAHGRRMVYASRALVNHCHPDGLGRYLFRKLRFGFYRARVYQRYPGRLRGDGYTPALMPLQIILSFLLLAIGISSPLSRGARRVALPATFAFLATAWPLFGRAWGKDRRLAPLVPFLLFVRSLAQGLGLLAGSVALVTRGVGVRASGPKRPS
jgi:glycosyltransferase involved in cell wall biosynthesis